VRTALSLRFSSALRIRADRPQSASSRLDAACRASCVSPNDHEARASPAMMEARGSQGAAERNPGSSAAHSPIPSCTRKRARHPRESGPRHPRESGPVIPAKAGSQWALRRRSRGVPGLLDSRVRGNDEGAGAYERTRVEPDDSRAPAGPAPGTPVATTPGLPRTMRAHFHRNLRKNHRVRPSVCPLIDIFALLFRFFGARRRHGRWASCVSPTYAVAGVQNGDAGW